LSSYTIVIASDEPGKTNATIGVDIDSATARVREISVHVGDDGEPFPAAFTRLDFRQLMETAALLSRGHLPEDEAVGEGEEASDGVPSEAASKDSRPTTNGRSARRSRGAARRATDAPSDLAVVYWRLGSVAKVAKHYDVTHQIARDWVRHLREGGTLPSPWRQKKARRS
jgi:hypothetical protein